MEQRASDLETQLSDALVDVQRRDATIFELKAALQVRIMYLMRTHENLVVNLLPIVLSQAKGVELNITGASPVKARSGQLPPHPSAAVARKQ